MASKRSPILWRLGAELNWVIFTAPNGEPLLMDIAEATIVRRPTPQEIMQDNVGAVIFFGAQHYRIAENFEAVLHIMAKIGIPIHFSDGRKVKP
jgi:hypothetical protein